MSTPLPNLPKPDTSKPFAKRDWDERYCPHQYYRHDDGSTDCPACARAERAANEIEGKS